MERHRKRFFSGNNIQKKLLTAVSCLIISSGILITSLGHVRFVFDYSRQAAEDSQQLVEQVSLNINTYLDEVARLCLSPYYSSALMAQLETAPATEQEQLKKRRDIESYLRQVMTMPRKDILRVFILADSVYSCARTGHAGMDSDYKTQDWYTDALASDDCIYLPDCAENADSSVFSFAKRLRSLQNSGKTVGVIRVDANYSGIRAVCDRVTVSPNGALFIADPDGNMIYENSRLPETVSVSRFLDAASENGSHTVSVNRKTYLVNAQSVETAGWRVVAINARSEVTKSAQQTLIFNMILAIALAVIGVAICAYYVQKLLKPLYRTVNLMKQVQSGNLNVRAEEAGTEEIAYLNSAFNQMLTQIQKMILQENQLTKQIYEAKYLQKKAQFDALNHQIRPHFLFNTLNTISLLVKCGRNKEAVDGIDQLATLLRGMVNGNQTISLAAELKIVESYLHLQQLRHDSLSYEIHTDSIDQSYLLPALSLQPLVENAFVHGCETASGNLLIRIAVTTEEDTLLISVQDNGIGMDPAALESLREKLAHCDEDTQSASGSIGLINIQRRLHLMLGQQYGIQITSAPGVGTTATLILPRG